jgi:hypothetical protein
VLWSRTKKLVITINKREKDKKKEINAKHALEGIEGNDGDY